MTSILNFTLDDLNKEKKNSTLTSYLKKKESLNLHKKQEVIDKVYLNYLKNYKKQSNFISKFYFFNCWHW